MKIKGFFKDVKGADRVTKARRENIENASEHPNDYDPIGATARSLHPGKMKARLVSKTPTSESSTTLRFEALDKPLPRFKPGQFLTVSCQIGDSYATRAYSIISAPYEAKQKENPYVEITVVGFENLGFMSKHLVFESKIGDIFDLEVGLGQFYYDPIRDSKDIICIAGGGAVTPFLSMARAINHGDMKANMTIIFGSNRFADIILEKELEEQISKKVKVVHVIQTKDKRFTGERGLITLDIIKKYMKKGVDYTFFACVPQPMYAILHDYLDEIKIPARRRRFENYGTPQDITKFDKWDPNQTGKSYIIKVIQGIKKTNIPAKSTEPIAVSLERANLRIHTACRGGSCGFCRSKLLSGEIFVSPKNDGRRKSDIDFNYFHPCVSYPLSDLTIKIPIELPSNEMPE